LARKPKETIKAYEFRIPHHSLHVSSSSMQDLVGEFNIQLVEGTGII